MKKRIIFLVILLLLTTGCTCEYNLIIEDSKYQEEIIITADTIEEKNNLNQQWIIEVDEDEYNKVKENPNKDDKLDYYNYTLNNNKLTFTHDFSRTGLIKSTAISRCYNQVSVSSQDNKTIISTSNKTKCFENYPNVTTITINITTTKKVTSNNADRVNGNTYTWIINKNNQDNKPINMVIEDNDTINGNNQNNENNQQNETKKNNYTLYIFAGILLAIMLIGYYIFNKFKDKNNKMDD